MDKIRQKLKMYAHHPASFLLALLVWISAIFTAVTLIFIVGYILIKGVPHLTPQLFELEYNSEKRYIWWNMRKKEINWCLLYV